MFALLNNPANRKIAGILLAVVAVLIALVVVLTSGKQLDARHRPLNFAETFDFDTGTYADYTAYSERRLRAAHADASDEVIANLAPFRMEPPADCPVSTTATFRNGVLLTHDLLESPYSMRELGKALQARCFLVYGLLLPGHGSRPGDLLRSDWEDWVAAEKFAARELAREVDNLYLGGHGAGGTLAILEASNNAGVDGLVLFAPALDTHMSPWQTIPGAVLGWLIPGARWAEVLPTVSAYRFDSRPYRLIGQTNALIEAMAAALPTRPFEVPVFTVLSLEDETVNPRAILDYMAVRVHPLSHTLVYTRHQATALPAMTVVRTYFPDEGVLSLSHLGLMIPQHDPDFGWYGTGKSCGHYFRGDRATYASCMAGDRAYLGEITEENLQEGVVERIGFNPFFYDMLEILDTFVAPVGRVQPRIRR